ncbi:tetratricopeptide repeat protein [Colwelliaceae bacterium MEBiC 14330]
MKKTRVFQFIAICIPFAFFALLELGLRVIDYGQETPLFIDYPNSGSADAPQYLLPRPDVIKRYFPQAAKPPSVTIETNFFLKDKPEDGLRIFVQGGSTAAGFPFGYGASIAGMLDYRLKQSFPERTVEVVNTALSAVNSYTILDFVDEIIAQKPDAVLIYAGHNEYLGILGVGSAYTAANSPTATLLYLKLKDSRIFQLLQNLYWQFAQPSEQGNNQTSRTFMAKVAKHKNIAYGSDLYQAGLQQFQRNMSLVLDKYQAAGIPVFISSIASNLADQAPFSSEPVQSVNKAATTNANVFYQQGKKLIAKGEYEKAKQALTKARDYDLLRFRAPSAINTIINELATSESVHFVDANQQLVDAAKDNIIGNDLMLEHLHPTIDGYFIIADSFYKALAKSAIFGRFPQYIKTELAQQDLPVFDAEVYWGKAKIAGLMADYPFTNSPQKVQLPVAKTPSDRLGLAAYKKQIDWLTIAKENLGYGKRHDQALYVKSAKLLADAMPFDANHNYRAGTALIKRKAFGQARRYLMRAIAIDKKNINYQLALSHSLLEQGKLEQALPWLESVRRIAPNNATVIDVLPKVRAHLAKN